MENFKSFGKKVRIPFFPGFTAITGPNGSGKSNISDAIRFVLGPKSSKVIRAERLTDLIFNGGKHKKNPAKYCTVSLVFDNKDRRMPIDSDTVTLTRTIKRAPLKNNPDNYYSYFYINGKPASLSDFVNLLTHARISGDGYNLVRQGDITSLVEMGPVERRKIIDDIAGISAFDADIEKAEKEKKEVEENIERIKIILDEVERQLAQLKRDRDEAIRYKELQEKLYEIKAKIAYKKKIEIEEQLKEIQAQIENYEKERRRLEEIKEKKLKSYEEMKRKLESIEERLAESGGEEAKKIKENIDLLKTELAKVEERISYMKKESREREKERVDLERKLSILLSNLKNKEEILKNVENEFSEKKQKVDELERELSNLKEQISQRDKSAVELSKELSNLRKEYFELTDKSHQLSLKKERIEESIKNISATIAQLEESKKAYEFELKDIEWNIQERIKEQSKLAKEKERIEKKLFEKQREEALISKRLREVEQSIRVLQREYSQLKAEYEARESVKKGYTNAVLKILEARDKGLLRGIHGTVAELIRVDPKYKIAIQAAGGQRLQAVIVDDDEVASEAIEFLRRNKLGRATFLPLNKMISSKPRAKALLIIGEDKVLGFAKDLISYRKDYESAIWFVLGDTVVVEDLDTARKLMGGVRLVTLRGDLIEASGAIKGGSIEDKIEFSQIDRSRIDEVEKKLSELTSEHNSLLERLEEVRKEIHELRRKKEDISTRKVFDIGELQARKKEYLSKLKIVEEELDKKKKEISIREEEKKKLEEEIEMIRQRIEEINKIKEEKGKIVVDVEESIRKVRQLEELLFTAKEELLKLESEKKSVQKDIDVLLSKKQDIEKRLHEVEERLDEIEREIARLKESKEEYKEKIEALIKVEDDLTGKIKGLTEEKEETYRKIVSLETEIDKLTTKIESYSDLITRAQYRIPTVEATLKEVEREVSRYGIEIDPSDLPSIEALKESEKLVEENLQELEPVNMRAIEEYDHQEKRKRKLEEEIEHLKEQKKNLLKAVEEISKKKKEKFYEVFNEINKNFKEIYSRLSYGGEASLELENPEDPFAGGLNIKVKPRGKKVFNISSLSGGEKSMASLALIFAIQRYDPSPFYVLDEVDMYLDSVNAEAVSRMIKENSKRAQFIMISLRKVTLKEADHIYGVTMREDGISEVVGTVDLDSIGPKGEILTHGRK